jgi:hypothetical protein
MERETASAKASESSTKMFLPMAFSFDASLGFKSQAHMTQMSGSDPEKRLGTTINTSHPPFLNHKH